VVREDIQLGTAILRFILVFGKRELAESNAHTVSAESQFNSNAQLNLLSDRIVYTLSISTNLNFGLTKILAIVNNIPATVIINSGSQVSIVNSRFVHKCGPLTYTGHIVGVTNHNSIVQGWALVQIYLTNLPLIFFNNYVLNDFKYDLLLGTDFHNYNELVVSYQSDYVEIKGHKILLITNQSQFNHVSAFCSKLNSFIV